MSKLYGGKMGVSLEHLKGLTATIGDVSRLSQATTKEATRACLQLAASAGDLIAELERLLALEQSVVRMAMMLNEREWAEHGGVGAAVELEQAITAMHNELAAETLLGERYRAGRAIATNDEFMQGMESVMQAEPLPAPTTGVSYDQFMDLIIERAKEVGLWPIQEVLH